MKSSLWETYTTVSRTQNYKVNSNAVMYMPRKNAETVLQDFTAAAVVQQIRIISMEALQMPMTSDVSLKKNVLNVPL